MRLRSLLGGISFFVDRKLTAGFECWLDVVVRGFERSDTLRKTSRALEARRLKGKCLPLRACTLLAA